MRREEFDFMDGHHKEDRQPHVREIRGTRIGVGS